MGVCTTVFEAGWGGGTDLERSIGLTAREHYAQLAVYNPVQ